MRRALQEANRAIRRLASEDPDKAGMGTTLTAAMLAADRLDVVHVGDSRAYLWRDGELRQLTQDHSVVAELVRRGSLSAEDAEHHPHRNVITRALGAEPEVVADTVSEPLRDGDVVLLCSDGLSSYVPERDIAGVLAAAASLREAAEALVERANAAGGTDNVTVVLARAGPVPAESGGTAESPLAEGREPGSQDDRDAGARRRPRACRHGARQPHHPPAARARARAPPALTGARRGGGRARGGGGRGRHPRLGREPQLHARGGARRHRARDRTGCRCRSPASTWSPPWQETGVSAAAVRAEQPEVLSSSWTQGQGDAVRRAADLVWRYGLPPVPTIEPPPVRPPAPGAACGDPRDLRSVTLRARELGFLIPAALLGLVGMASVATARADELDLGPLPGAGGVVLVFLAMHAALRFRAPQADPYLLPTVGVLTAIGLVELDRISPALAADQAVWVAVGGAVFIAVLLLLPDHRVLERYRYLIGLTGVGLLVITMVFGTRINGAKLWIDIGGGQTVQLGEVSKVLIVIFLAAYLRDKRELLAIPTRRVMGVPMPPMAALGPVLLFLVACLGLVAILNDFGTALLFLGVFLAMIYLATGRVAYTGFGLGLFLAGSVVVYTVVPRIQDRVQNWLDPFGDERGPGLPARPVALRDGPGRGRGPRPGQGLPGARGRLAGGPAAADRLHVLRRRHRAGLRGRRRAAAGLPGAHPARPRDRRRGPPTGSRSSWPAG